MHLVAALIGLALGPILFVALHRRPALSEAVDGFVQDPDVRVLMFTGAGEGFSAGGDMAFMEQLSQMAPFEIKETVYKHFAGAAKAIKLCPKPTIAAVNGAAVGAGIGVKCVNELR